MTVKRAKTLDEQMQAQMLAAIATDNPHEARDRVMVLLSFKAGLRAQEIAGLEWKDVCDAKGKIRKDAFFVPGDIAKGHKDAHVPMNPHLYTALCLLRAERPTDKVVVYGIGKSRDAKKGARMTPDGVRQWFKRTYTGADFIGCTSHSGRRTFITSLARKCNDAQCSIRDVQILARHSSLQTTEAYIEISPHAARLVAII